MANWCTNYLVLSGSEEQLLKVRDSFKEMLDSNSVFPLFMENDIDDNDRAFFDILFEDDDLNRYVYQTKWVSNTETLIKIAKNFNVSFTVEYCEPGLGVYGMVTYDIEDGSMIEEDLPEEHFFDGQSFEEAFEL